MTGIFALVFPFPQVQEAVEAIESVRRKIQTNPWLLLIQALQTFSLPEYSIQ